MASLTQQALRVAPLWLARGKSYAISSLITQLLFDAVYALCSYDFMLISEAKHTYMTPTPIKQNSRRRWSRDSRNGDSYKQLVAVNE